MKLLLQPRDTRLSEDGKRIECTRCGKCAKLDKCKRTAEGFLKYFRRVHNCNPAKTSEQAKKSMSIVMNRWVFAGSHLEEISSFCGCKEKRAGMYTTGMFSICCYWEWDLSTGKWDPRNKIWAGNWGWSSPSGPSFKPTFVN